MRPIRLAWLLLVAACGKSAPGMADADTEPGSSSGDSSSSGGGSGGGLPGDGGSGYAGGGGGADGGSPGDAGSARGAGGADGGSLGDGGAARGGSGGDGGSPRDGGAARGGSDGGDGGAARGGGADGGSTRGADGGTAPGGPVSYTTNFDLAEAPISEGGAWTHNCVDRAVVDTAGGFAFGTQAGTGAFNDSYASLSGFPPNQAASAVIHLNASAIAGGTHEVEILLRFADGPHLSRGYECNLAFDGSYTQIVRWDSGGTFVYLSPSNGNPTGNPGSVHDGDVFSAQIVGNVITVYLNGAQINTATDGTYADGNPGMAFWRANPSSVQSDFGFTSYSARSL